MKTAALLLLCSGLAAAATPASLFYDHSNPAAAFAAAEIHKAYVHRGESLIERPLQSASPNDSGTRLLIAADRAESSRIAGLIGAAPPKSDKWQSYSIRKRGDTIAVLAADSAGAMYGGLDLAEAVRLGTLAELADSDHSPHIDRRGIKFNIPLDVRTPSYSDNSDSAQKNIGEMWSFDFWRDFLDEMARHRFNVLTLWNLHPFPSIVKVPEFPDIALDDVKRTLIPLDDTYSTSGSDMFRPVMMSKVETVRKMTIDEKIGFWRSVMAYAHNRGIEVYWFTWNIFMYGAEGKYGITSQQTNQATINYLRASVREAVLTYPQLDGIGITAGEHMEELKGANSKENWLWKTYGQGIMDAKKLQPDRKFRLIHRYHQTVQSEILDAFKDYTDTFELSFKYSIAHMYSIPNPPFIQEALPNITAEHRTWLTVRDDDIYSFRWGNPEFAREFIRNMPGPDKVAGFYMGPDGYVWGREFLSTEPETPRQLVISKRWYSFMLWGRLSYEPDLPDTLFRRTIAYRFPELAADRANVDKMFQTWAEASKIFPQITRFFWGDIDVRWFPEACLSHPRGAQGFYTVKHFVEGDTMPGSGVLNIIDWRRKKLAGQPMEGTTPIEIADALSGQASKTLRMVAELRSVHGQTKELRLTLGDMEAMAHLGNYYSEKVRAAADLALFDKSGKPEERESAIRHLQAALDHWKRYANVYVIQYEQPKLYNRVGVVDIPGLISKVEQDISIARLWTPGTEPDTPRQRRADTPFRK
jgi:hypothetical protein